MMMAQNILYCPEDVNYKNSLFGSITDFADVRHAVHKAIKPANAAITVLSMCEGFNASHISTLDLLHTLTKNNPELHDLVNNKNLCQGNDHSFYSTLFFSFFLPNCSIHKLFSL